MRITKAELPPREKPEPKATDDYNRMAIKLLRNQGDWFKVMAVFPSEQAAHRVRHPLMRRLPPDKQVHVQVRPHGKKFAAYVMVDNRPVTEEPAPAPEPTEFQALRLVGIDPGDYSS
jgi:hypothetical protein